MKTFYLFLSLFLFLIANLYSQSSELNRTANWRFGHAAGLNFDKNNNYQASVFTGSKGVTFEGNATMSDTLGNLLFYCNGDTLWNALHQPMLNGAGLLSDKNTKVNSQIVPRPGSTTQYFVFVNGCVADQCINGLRYSVVDMTLDNGKGAVVQGQKNIVVMPNAYQGMAITKHGNGVDYWLTYSRYYGPPETTSKLLTIPITNAGPDTNNLNISPFDEETMAGSGRFSPNGQIFCTGPWSYYQFNNITGTLSNKLIPNNDSIGIGSNYFTYGFEFSPDSRFLYVCLVTGIGNNCIQQIDLSVYDSTAISNSIYTWQTYFGPPILQGLGHMQLAPDGKIYIAKTADITNTLHIIHNPNLLGASCNFQFDAVNIQTYSNFSLSIYPNYYFHNLKTSIYDPQFDDANISIYPNPTSNYINVQHKITETYTYILLNNFGEKIAMFNGNNLTKQINVADYTSGMYYLQILTKNTSTTKKIIINH